MVDPTWNPEAKAGQCHRNTKGKSQSRPLGLLGLIPMGEISDDHRSGHCEKDRAKSEVQVAGMVDVGHISTRD